MVSAVEYISPCAELDANWIQGTLINNVDGGATRDMIVITDEEILRPSNVTA